MVPIYKPIGEEQKCRMVPISFPAQHQDCQPGLEYRMQPQPLSENPAAKGSGKLCGKVAVITGGDSGIGRAVAYAFAREGADLVLSYLCEHEDARKTKRHVESLGRRCVLVPGDLKQASMAKQVIARTIDVFGKLDVLINNLGVQFVQNDIRDITEEQLDLTFRTNLYSFFFMIQAALPYLKPGSSIINTTSITAYRGEPELMDYSATKGGIMALTRSLSLSLKNKGIRVNGVAPGPTWTPLIPASYSAEQVRTFGSDTSRVPMNRAGQPFEIASSYVFLASDDASYMSGQVLHPNGGEIVGS